VGREISQRRKGKETKDAAGSGSIPEETLLNIYWGLGKRDENGSDYNITRNKASHSESAAPSRPVKLRRSDSVLQHVVRRTRQCGPQEKN